MKLQQSTTGISKAGGGKPGMLGRLSAVALAVAAMSAPLAASADPSGWLWGKNSSTASQQPAQSGSDAQPAQASTSAKADPPQNKSGQAVVIQNLLNQVQQMQQDMRELRGKMEVQANQIDRLKSSQRDGFASLDSRINKLEQSGNAAAGNTGGDTSAASAAAPKQPAAPSAPNAPSTPAAPAGGGAAASAATGAGGQPAKQPSADNGNGTPASTPAASAAQQPAKPDPAVAAKQQKLYNKAFGLLKDGNYDDAIKAFQAVVDTDPNGTWTPSALFWQGETYYVEQKWGQAEAAYQKVIKEFPKSGRVPDAMLKTGYVAYDQKQNAKARSIFKQVIAKYPNSQAANLAKARLDRMDREHR